MHIISVIDTKLIECEYGIVFLMHIHSGDEWEDTSSGFPGAYSPQSEPPSPSKTTNG